MISKHRNTGQTCVCANRLLIQDGLECQEFSGAWRTRWRPCRWARGPRPGDPGPPIDADCLRRWI